jgi:ATP-dependent helicase/nuclease subunit A
MFNDLTIQQLCALDYHRNMVVTAGPGAGKTRILSLRFCFILLTDERVTLPQILTLTFTEKAAEEMKGRMYEMLTALDKSFRQGGNNRLRERIREAKDQFDKNRISTIHSFCANLLREHPVESATDPDFRIIQGMRQQMILDSAIKEAMKTIWDENRDEFITLLRSFGGKKSLISAVRGLTENLSLYRRVLDTKDRLFSISDWKEQVFNDYCLFLKDRFVLPYMHGLIAQESLNDTAKELIAILEEWRPSGETEDNSYGIPALFGRMRALAGTGGGPRKRCAIDIGLRELSYIDMVNEHFPDLFILNNPDPIFEKELNSFMKVVKVSIEKYAHEKGLINSLDFSDLETRSLMFLKSMVENRRLPRLKRIQERYKYIMVDEFQDTNRIQWEIIRTLCMDTSGHSLDALLPGRIFVVGDKRQAIYRFRGGDVTVFERVTKEIKQSNIKPGPLFFQSEEMTGRIKEIDDGFDPYATTKRYNKLAINDQESILRGDIYLPHNFRSDKNPIAFFNRTFEEIFSSRHAGDIKNYETAPRDIMQADGKTDAPQAMGSVTIYIPPVSSDTEKAGAPETEATLIVKIIESILGKHGTETYEYRTYQDIRDKIDKNEKAIGILFYAFTHIRIFENILREAGLPFVIHRGKGFYKSSEVIEMLQLLNFLADERQEISLLTCLRGQIFGLTDPEVFDLFYNRKGMSIEKKMPDHPYIRKLFKEIESFRELASRLTISELIRTIISRRSLTAAYSAGERGGHTLLNMEKLMDIARRFQYEEKGSLRDFIKYCLDMAEQDEGEGEAATAGGINSPISLMTIHASKGLEFPMIILPQLDRKILITPDTGKPLRLYTPEDNNSSKWNSHEGDIPLWPVETPALGFRREKGPLMHLLTHRNSLEEVAENRRVFYVGCTRAENHLVLLCAEHSEKQGAKPVTLTSDDYREKANINQLLTDIYGLNLEYGENEGYGTDKFFPVIKRPEVKIEGFRGIEYSPQMPDPGSFGPYDDGVRALDLTAPVRSNPYLQVSFTSVRLFLKCPVRFYLKTLLKLKEGEYEAEHDDEERSDDIALSGDMEDYDSGDALYTGNFVHGYLERHRFGNPFDESLFEQIKKRMPPDNCRPDICLERVKPLLINTVADKRLIDLMKGKELYHEVPFLVTARPGIEFRGVMDMIMEEPETGLWTIIDWKSNDTKEKSPGEIVLESGYDIQLAFYRWALEKILNKKVERQYIYFLDNGQLLECNWPGNPPDMLDDISKKMDELEDREIWESEVRAVRDKGDECRFCGYTGLCNGNNLISL